MERVQWLAKSINDKLNWYWTIKKIEGYSLSKLYDRLVHINVIAVAKVKNEDVLYSVERLQ